MKNLTSAMILVSLLSGGALAAAADNMPEQAAAGMQCFGEKPLPWVLGTGPVRKTVLNDNQVKKNAERAQSMDHWLKEQASVIKYGVRPQDHILLKDEIITYKLSFDQDTRLGSAKLTQGGTDPANKAALELIKRSLPFRQPPSDAPYRHGLVIRLDKLAVTVHCPSSTM